jgi:hypothetical protein
MQFHFHSSSPWNPARPCVTWLKLGMGVQAGTEVSGKHNHCRFGSVGRSVGRSMLGGRRRRSRTSSHVGCGTETKVVARGTSSLPCRHKCLLVRYCIQVRVDDNAASSVNTVCGQLGLLVDLHIAMDTVLAWIWRALCRDPEREGSAHPCNPEFGGRSE